jgi:hypothetical protein
MKKAVIVALFVICAALAQNVTGKLVVSGLSSLIPNPVSPSVLFTTISTTFSHISAASLAGLTGMPTNCGGNACLGSQGGDLVNGYVLYYPWQYLSSVPHGALLWYQPGAGAFSSAAHWGVYDMQQSSGYSGSCPNTATYCPTAFNSGIVVGNTTYLVPGEANANPVFVLLNLASGTPSTAANYSYQNGTSITGSPPSPGWATGFYDGRYVWYAPTVANNTVLRHDTTLDGSGLSASGWVNYNLNSNCGINSSYLGSAYDANQYGYMSPGSGNSIILQINTQGSPTSCGSYASLDMTTIGSAGKPSFSGNGKPANMKNTGGVVIALNGNTTNGTQKLCTIPWAFRTQTSETLSATMGCVVVGTYTAGVWAAAANPPFSSTATWELYDLDALSANPQFASNGWNKNPGRVYGGSGALAGQSTIAGYQIGYAAGSNGCILLNASDAQFELEWNCAGSPATLANQANWSLGLIDAAFMGNNNYGGAFTGTVLYPSAAVSATYGLVQISGL